MRLRVTRRQLIAGSLVTVLVAGLVGWAALPSPASYRTSEQRISVRTGPDDATEVQLDTTLYLPKSATADKPVPAILLAHGFGGTKQSVRGDAEDFADLGYAVLTWTAQGFGRSTGEIHLDHPDWEVKDAQRLIDWLAARPDIAKDGGDPKVAAVGGSYGGALALLLAAQDKRVDAIVPMITWNDLSTAFLPNGVFKKQWAGLFFGNGSADPLNAAPQGSPGDPQCGRFAKDICQAYLKIATSGQAGPGEIARLKESSPAPVLDRIKAPTLLIQGQVDTLFPLSEGDANARGIAANGTPVRVAWFTGGHDGGTGPQSEVDRLRYLTAQWLDHYVKGNGDAPSGSFTYARVSGLNAQGRGLVTSASSVDDYPGLGGTGRSFDLQGPPQSIANPPDGTPAAISSLPIANIASLLNEGVSAEIPGQHADFVSAPLTEAYDAAGAPTVRIRAASETGEAVLFVKLYDVPAKGAASIPDGLIAPIRLTGLPKSLADAQPVTVTLPAVVHRFEAGSRVRVTVATADTAYWSPPEPAVYQVAVDGAVTLPTIAGTPIANPNVIWRYVLAGLIAAILLGLAIVLVVARRRTRRIDRSVDADLVDTPLVVRGLRKEYADFVAVSKVDFTVQRGQVVGLLGPNGAGKTTSLRVLMGLTRPTAGEILVFGHRLLPGAPVLSRVGALVEGPGFLPHLTGAQNLELYWKATGRPLEDAHFEEAYDIAGLGTAVTRRVKTYSHGMKQRLAIAQAMLGLPELLVLDEPTDGLDPPQIAEMRKVLRRYATGGRAVLVSSHLLAEVEQTCTDVVVMHKGEVVAAGPVDDIVGDSPTVQLDVSDVDAAEKVLEELTGVRSVAWSGGRGLVVDIDGRPRAEVVAALVQAGVGIDRVTPRRRLEDAFLSLVGGDTKASGER
ncbi:alpha/beta fold hydrolase [Dactylosporangium sucinum]|uniref:ABC transporter ATP-binding protein n=1 Tax=Dactylosporangium sucinum TaxID=1424081 RepID=A0A917WVV9_9ACTN|nr:alpha/beta fold hydrolase [Dactylosporangium sucinum]GGM33318.1 ABC transporter ATP-binding protein [Dactylosporangium sucinum]